MFEETSERKASSLNLLREASTLFDDTLFSKVAENAGENIDLTSRGLPWALINEKGRILSAVKYNSIMGILPSSDFLEQHNMQLQNENLLLRESIRRIEERLNKIEASIPTQKLVVLREISLDEAKKEIAQLFAEGKILYYSDIAEKLRLDLETVVEICNELHSKGEIEVVDNLL
jgi:hypothetical protein